MPPFHGGRFVSRLHGRRNKLWVQAFAGIKKLIRAKPYGPGNGIQVGYGGERRGRAGRYGRGRGVADLGDLYCVRLASAAKRRSALLHAGRAALHKKIGRHGNVGRFLEQETGIEPAGTSLGSWRHTIRRLSHFPYRCVLLYYICPLFANESKHYLAANLNFYGVTLNAKREKLSFRIFFYRMER